MKNEKTLMFAVSKCMPKEEAVSFGKTMTTDEAWYVYRERHNPTARDAGDREGWVVCRYPRTGEVVKRAYAIWVDEAGLELILDRGAKKVA